MQNIQFDCTHFLAKPLYKYEILFSYLDVSTQQKLRPSVIAPRLSYEPLLRGFICKSLRPLPFFNMVSELPNAYISLDERVTSPISPALRAFDTKKCIGHKVMQSSLMTEIYTTAVSAFACYFTKPGYHIAWHNCPLRCSSYLLQKDL